MKVGQHIDKPMNYGYDCGGRYYGTVKGVVTTIIGWNGDKKQIATSLFDRVTIVDPKTEREEVLFLHNMPVGLVANV